MDLAVVMHQDVLADKLEDGRVRGRAVATWNTRRLPTRLTSGWTNRLFVASQGRWRGYFPLSGDIFWNPKDAAAPYALIVDPRHWTPIAAAPCPSFRGWRYLESVPGGAPEVAKPDSEQASEGGSSPPRTSSRRAQSSAASTSPTAYCYFFPTGRDTAELRTPTGPLLSLCV